jgi:hypothetical protein
MNCYSPSGHLLRPWNWDRALNGGITIATTTGPQELQRHPWVGPWRQMFAFPGGDPSLVSAGDPIDSFSYFPNGTEDFLKLQLRTPIS